MRLLASRPWMTGLILPVILGVTWEVAVRFGWALGRLMPPPSRLAESAWAVAASGAVVAR